MKKRFPGLKARACVDFRPGSHAGLKALVFVQRLHYMNSPKSSIKSDVILFIFPSLESDATSRAASDDSHRLNDTDSFWPVCKHEQFDLWSALRGGLLTKSIADGVGDFPFNPSLAFASDNISLLFLFLQQNLS